VDCIGRLDSTDALLITRKILGLTPTPIPDFAIGLPNALASPIGDVARSIDPVVRTDLQSMPQAKAAGAAQVGAPVIDWTARPASSRPALQSPPKADSGKVWLDSFVNHLGRTQDERNLAFKLRIPAVPAAVVKATVSLSTME